jgi:uncharacterized OB-fold protein
MAVIPISIPMQTFPGEFSLAELCPPVTAAQQPQIDALRQGLLIFQACAQCGRLRGLVAPVCPYCTGRRWDWRPSSGAGTVVSWVRYHRAYLDAFKALVPYVVLCVELDEHIRVFGRSVGASAGLAIGHRVTAIIERWVDGGLAPAFVVTAEY